MKTFKDLEFEGSDSSLQAKCFFPNGYGISVIRFKMSGCSSGYGSFTSNDEEWEAAVLEGDEHDSNITFKTATTDDVYGHLSDKKVTELMKKIQKLKKSQKVKNETR